MRTRPLAPVALAAVAVAACGASLPIERREYILSRPHGWIELTVEDGAIPLVPSEDEDDPGLVAPRRCWLGVYVDGEPFVEGSLFPAGEAPPFHVKSGFRFPVPVGTLAIEADYGDCRVSEDGKRAVVSFETSVDVAEKRVTDLSFDGLVLRVAGGPRTDTAATLERIYEAVAEGREAP